MAEETEESAPKSTLEIWRRRLNSPARMSAFVLGLLLVVAFAGVYWPLSSQIDEASARLARAHKRQQLAVEVEVLRQQAKLYRGRTNHRVDLYDWTDYINSGVHLANVALVKMEPKPIATMSAGAALGWSLDLEGGFTELCRFADWLEHSEQLIAIESLAIENHEGRLIMTLAIRDLVLK